MMTAILDHLLTIVLAFVLGGVAVMIALFGREFRNITADIREMDKCASRDELQW